MNYNRNEVSLQHLYNILREPAKREALQAAFNNKRYLPIENALGSRLIFTPLTFRLNAEGQPEAYNQKTDALNYDTIVLGYMSDGGNRDIILNRADNAAPIVYIGDANSLYLTLDDIAGQPQNTNPKGQKGIFYLPQPEIFYKGERISLDIFKRDDTPESELVKFVIVGLRVFTKQETDAAFARELPVIRSAMEKRPTQKNLYLKVEVVFSEGDGDGKNGYAEVLTPQMEEPLLIRGMRSSLLNSNVDFGLVGEAPLTEKPVPIWSFAHGDEIPHENYLFYPRGIYLPPKVQVRFGITNNGVAFDEQGTTDKKQTITLICQTM